MDKKPVIRIICFLYFISFSIISFSQCHDVRLTTQEEVDNFNCDVVTGHLEISGEFITNLDSLQRIETIIGQLLIEYNPNLVSLPNFENLKSVNNIYIGLNDNLQSVKGFNNIDDTFIGDVSIYDNESLVEIQGFNSIEKCNNLFLEENENLTSLKGFEKINNISTFSLSIRNLNSIPEFNNVDDIGSLNIVGCDSLFEINLFNKINVKVHSIQIERNENLTSLNIGNETKQADLLEITNNPALVSLNVYEKIEQVELYIIIKNNDALKVIPDYNRLEYVEELGIRDNDLLNSINGFESLISTLEYGIIIIEDNRSLNSINGFSSFIGLPEIFTSIKSNENLSSINGFSNLKFPSKLELSNNSTLMDCCFITDIIANNLNQDYSQYIQIENNDSGCNDISEVIQSCISEVQIVKSDRSIKYGPNPASDYINFIEDKYNRFIEIRIINLAGQIIAKQPYTKNVNISYLKKGMYTIALIDDKLKEYNLKFIKS